MENVLIILTSLFCLAMVVTIVVYNYFDRLNFRIERLLKRYKDVLDIWAEECEKLVSGSSEAYFKAKRPRLKVKGFRSMITAVRDGTDELPEITSQLQDFFSSYNVLAENYDQKLSSPVLGPIARISRQSPWGKLDFYADADF